MSDGVTRVCSAGSAFFHTLVEVASGQHEIREEMSSFTFLSSFPSVVKPSRVNCLRHLAAS